MGILVPTSHVNSYWTHDPYWDNVELLLHGEGANGGSTITDSSSRGRTVSVSGSTTSTAQKKFGNSSILGGTNNTFQVALGSGGSMSADFTFEMFIKTAGGVFFFSEANYPTTYNYFYDVTGQGWQTQGTAIWTGWNSSWVSGASWYHFAISRVGSNLRFFLDGALKDTVVNSSTIDLQTLTFGYFKPNNNLWYPGYYDEIRITKGVGRYAAAFTAPFLQFADS